MKIKSSYHVHSNFCDGKNSLEEMTAAAISKNFTHLGFSSHAPSFMDNNSTMKINSFKEYKKEVLLLKEKYKDKINIFLALEYDCFEDTGMDEAIDAAELDYFILSVHWLGTAQNRRAIDYTEAEFKELIDLAEGNVKAVIKRYYDLLISQAVKHKPHIIGHLDIIKKNNINSKYFNEKEDWYLNLADNFLKQIKKTGCVIEINTGGVARYGISCFYPSDEILLMTKDYDIPLMLNSDAHIKENLDFYYEKAIDKLKKTGIKKLHYITDSGWNDYKI